MNHSGKRPRRRSDDESEASLALWLDRSLIRRTRSISKYHSGRQLTSKQTARLNSILAQAPPTKDHFERCNELKQWCMNHSGERPRRRSDDNTEAALAMWLERALIRRNGAYSNRPSGRQLTAKETAYLNSIVPATGAPPPGGHANEHLNSIVRATVGHVATTSKLDMKSSQRGMRKRFWELGLPENGDKQALLARILNEENSLTTDSQVKDSDTDQDMLRTFWGN